MVSVLFLLRSLLIGLQGGLGTASLARWHSNTVVLVATPGNAACTHRSLARRRKLSFLLHTVLFTDAGGYIEARSVNYASFRIDHVEAILVAFLHIES